MPTSSTPAAAVVAFDGHQLIASGALPDVARAVKSAERNGFAGPLLLFDATTSEPIELDLRDNADPTSPIDAPRGPGRPRLGVVAREVTLLPRHWDWLATQSGGASAALRRLVDQARIMNAGRDRLRLAQEHAYRFMSAVLGDQPGFEEATRALFAGDALRFTTLSEPWPTDTRDHTRRLAAAVFTS